mmetsp:Transcript_16668/g.47059  ORF Transcript_16668/g.47059 Transcript_16668/m.47059 type:complete len:200 (-) Transcript_16668:899-1498(-)
MFLQSFQLRSLSRHRMVTAPESGSRGNVGDANRMSAPITATTASPTSGTSVPHHSRVSHSSTMRVIVPEMIPSSILTGPNWPYSRSSSLHEILTSETSRMYMKHSHNHRRKRHNSTNGAAKTIHIPKEISGASGLGNKASNWDTKARFVPVPIIVAAPPTEAEYAVPNKAAIMNLLAPCFFVCTSATSSAAQPSSDTEE